MTPKRAPNRLAAARARLAADDLDGALAMATAADTADPEVKALIHTIRLEKASRLIASGQLDEGRQSLAMVPAGFAGKEVAEQALEAASKERQVAIDLATARNDFDQGRYRQCLERIEALLMVSPDNRQAADLETEARYRLALDHFDRQRYMDARGLLENANEEHEASAALRSSIDSRLAECAQIHYRNGVKHFINENLQSAITEWEKALDCNPQHAKARQNIENARRLLQKIESMP
jgi:tetratricopeptide (TPR) repeat protein